MTPETRERGIPEEERLTQVNFMRLPQSSDMTGSCLTPPPTTLAVTDTPNRHICESTNSDYNRAREKGRGGEGGGERPGRRSPS